MKPIFGQNIDKLERQAQKIFYRENFLEAAEAYQEVLKVAPKNGRAAYRIEICSLLVIDRKRPITNLLAYKNTQGRKDKFYQYWLARVYFERNNFTKAIESWNKFNSLKSYKSKEIIEEVQIFNEWAIAADEYYRHPVNYEIDQLPAQINSPLAQLSPVLFKTENELLFLSTEEIVAEGKTLFYVYQTVWENEKWSEPSLLTQFGAFKKDNANIEVLNDSNKMFLYKEGQKGALYFSEKNASDWGELQIFNKEISKARLESHFFINSDENKILFAHRNKNKPHDLDLLVTNKNVQTGRWEKPQLISNSITSDQDEDYPFLTPDGNTLYFSSKGFNSIGGYDVFKSEYDRKTNKWSAPLSLKHPTNTINDDIQFKIDEESNSGYFVSNRLDSNGDLDIFLFHEVAKVQLSGQVIDSLNKPSDFAEIHFYPKRTTGLDIKTMTDKDGNYKVLVGNDDQLVAKIFYNNKLVIEEEFNIPAFEDEKMAMVKNFKAAQERKPIPPDLPLDEDPTYADIETIGSKFRATNKVLLSNIYFEFGKYSLTTSQFPQLQPLLRAMIENPKLQIEISGHTDNIGERESNNRLSLLRASAITNYLAKKGISKTRLIPRGYGSSRPIASNDQEREGRELNRRIEVLVIE